MKLKLIVRPTELCIGSDLQSKLRKSLLSLLSLYSVITGTSNST